MGFFDRPTTRILRRREWVPSGKAGSRNEGGNNGNGGGNNGGGNNGGGTPSPPGGGGPKLTSPSGTTTGATTADLSVSTNGSNGTLYWVVTTTSTAPTRAQVKAGQDSAGAAGADSGSQAVSASGAQAITGGATGLTAETEYWAHFMHERANGSQSGVATSASFTTEAAATTPLDGLTPTGAWSFSRKLFSAYAGDLYQDDGSGNADILYDQSGNTRNFTESSIGPVVTTFGPNNRTCGDFDNANDFLQTVGNNLGVFINADAAYVVVSGVWDTLSSNNASSFNNHGMIGDAGGFLGIYGKSGGVAHAQNWDGSDDSAAGTIAAGTGAVVSLRHEGGSLFVTVNGTESAATTSGDTTTLTNLLRLGRANNTSTIFLDGKVIECAIFDTVPNEATRQAIEADFKLYAGF